MDEENPNQFTTGLRHDKYVYNFCCPACGSCGELGVPKESTWLPCPEKCGARFVQWLPPRSDRKALRCVNVEEARARIAFARAHAMKINGSR